MPLSNDIIAVLDKNIEPRILAILEKLPEDELREFLMSYGILDKPVKPQFARLLESIPSQDVQDFLALQGVGALERQCKAQFNRFVATNIPGFITLGIVCFVASLLALLTWVLAMAHVFH